MKQKYALGFDLGGSFIKYGLVSSRGKVVQRGSCPTPVRKVSAEITAILRKLAVDLLEQARVHGLDVVGIGIGSPGSVDCRSGRVLGASPNLPGWPGTNLKLIFSKFALPVFADNDANLMALGELRLGAARGYKNAICLTVGTGIGSGIILEGRLYRGSAYGAGELGHMSINFSGKRCRCGRVGCLEAYASIPAMLDSAEKLLQEQSNGSKLANRGVPLVLEHILSAKRQNDSIAVRVLEAEAEFLSTGLANLVHLLNPEIIVIGGGLVEADSSILRNVHSKLKAKTFRSTSGKLRVAKAKLGYDAGFIGAALYSMESLGIK